MEKVTLLDKWFCRPTELDNLRYSQFGKMYEHIQESKVPKKPNKDLSKKEKEKLQEFDYIYEPDKNPGEGIILPKYQLIG